MQNMSLRLYEPLIVSKSPEGALRSASTRLLIPTRSLLRAVSGVACVRRTSLSLMLNRKCWEPLGVLDVFSRVMRVTTSCWPRRGGSPDAKAKNRVAVAASVQVLRKNRKRADSGRHGRLRRNPRADLVRNFSWGICWKRRRCPRGRRSRGAYQERRLVTNLAVSIFELWASFCVTSGW